MAAFFHFGAATYWHVAVATFLFRYLVGIGLPAAPETDRRYRRHGPAGPGDGGRYRHQQRDAHAGAADGRADLPGCRPGRNFPPERGALRGFAGPDADGDEVAGDRRRFRRRMARQTLAQRLGRPRLFGPRPGGSQHSRGYDRLQYLGLSDAVDDPRSRQGRTWGSPPRPSARSRRWRAPAPLSARSSSPGISGRRISGGAIITAPWPILPWSSCSA